MTSLNQIRQPAASMSGRMRGLTSLLSDLGRSLGRLGHLRGAPANTLAETVTPPSAALSRAIEAGSNHELDWLWAATQVEHISERRYCLRRALEINPASDMALHELDRIGW